MEDRKWEYGGLVLEFSFFSMSGRRMGPRGDRSVRLLETPVASSTRPCVRASRRPFPTLNERLLRGSDG
jgi:hypothetical protein